MNDSNESASKLKPTLNGFGWSFDHLDPITTDFFALAPELRLPVADLGCGFGHCTRKLLQLGATVIANDLDKRHLEETKALSGSEFEERLTLLEGDATKLAFEPESLGGILASKVILFLPSADVIRKFLKQCYEWLAPEGALAVTASQLLQFAVPEAYEKYLDRRKQNEEWPGWLTRDDIREELREFLPEKLYGWDEVVLERELRRAGFEVEQCYSYGAPGLMREGYYEDASVGAIARKGLP